MAVLTLEMALLMSQAAFAKAKQLGTAPLTVAVLDAGGQLVNLQRQDGSSLLRPQIAMGKAWGALALGKASRRLGMDAELRPAFYAALNAMSGGQVVPVPGGVLIRDAAEQVIGAVGISGDTSDIDESCAIAGVEALGLLADAGR
ncbi:GlcG/HbpS family heme-binding protein [Balneatrix alpica]|uniref:Heme-binding protein n=1 Tax=Balneatrix alpica TaxID=75684 RepID=A0ABV5ZAI3_9GAMM|nr:heme-binding protein [Balneatrix alpica]